jgi:hypothetical protein
VVNGYWFGQFLSSGGRAKIEMWPTVKEQWWNSANKTVRYNAKNMCFVAIGGMTPAMSEQYIGSGMSARLERCKPKIPIP